MRRGPAPRQHRTAISRVRDAARTHEVRDVCARDQEHERDGTEQHEQRSLKIADDAL